MKLESKMPDEEITIKLAEVFKVFGDNTRLRVLWSLFDKELCVLDIAEEVSMSQSAVSHQLKTLKSARLVKARREGKQTFYSLDDEHIKQIIETGLLHSQEK